MLSNEMPENSSMTLMMGEMRGQLRELIHGFNNLSQTVSGLASAVDKSTHIPGEIAEMKVRVAAIELRLAALEADQQRRVGAMSVGQWLLKSPILGWIAAGAVAVAALFARDKGL